MERKYCETGLMLCSDYVERTLAWVNAEAEKRVAVRTAQAAQYDKWIAIASQADNSRKSHDGALSAYFDHVIVCPLCRCGTNHRPSATSSLADDSDLNFP